jgi:hypothetical protein
MSLNALEDSVRAEVPEYQLTCCGATSVALQVALIAAKREKPDLKVTHRQIRQREVN